MQTSRTPVPRRIAAAVLVSAALAAQPGVLAQEGPEGAGNVDQRIQQLIEQLGHADYFVRRRAQAELAEFSFKAFDALDAATAHDDLEIAARAKYLLGLMRVQWAGKDAPPEVKRLLADYELQNDTAKLSRMRALAKLPDGKGIAALCRLVRFERSLVLSKHAAIELLNLGPRDKPPGKEVAEQLQKSLSGSRRAAARWLLTWLRFGTDPEAALADWTKLVEAEDGLLRRSPAKTSAPIVAKLVRFRVEWLKKLDRKDEVLAAMHRLVDLQRGSPETLAELLEWLIDHKAWEAVDELATRFAPQFADNPILLYTVAQAQAEQGDQKQAEKTARQALKLNPGNDRRQLTKHYLVAQVLQERGRMAWAAREYRHVIDAGPAGTSAVLAAQYEFSEMLHDQEKDLEAAEVRRGLLEAFEKQPDVAKLIRDTPEAVGARMNYFFACHFQSKHDMAKQREYLDKAVEGDAPDVDALIARYRLSDDQERNGQTPEYRAKTLALIKKETARLRRQITAEPDSPTGYNHFAWLVGNTEGDFDEALKYSKKSLELKPDSGAFHDTLAHVYFGKGDYENAFRTQQKAVELEPHSRQIAKQLEVFRKKWEKERAKGSSE